MDGSSLFGPAQEGEDGALQRAMPRIDAEHTKLMAAWTMGFQRNQQRNSW